MRRVPADPDKMKIINNDDYYVLWASSSGGSFDTYGDWPLARNSPFAFARLHICEVNKSKSLLFVIISGRHHGRWWLIVKIDASAFNVLRLFQHWIERWGDAQRWKTAICCEEGSRLLNCVASMHPSREQRLIYIYFTRHFYIVAYILSRVANNSAAAVVLFGKP